MATLNYGAGRQYTSLQAACNASKPGDVIKIYDDVTSGTINPQSGTLAAPITLEGVVRSDGSIPAFIGAKIEGFDYHDLILKNLKVTGENSVFSFTRGYRIKLLFCEADGTKGNCFSFQQCDKITVDWAEVKNCGKANARQAISFLLGRVQDGDLSGAAQHAIRNRFTNILAYDNGGPDNNTDGSAVTIDRCNPEQDDRPGNDSIGDYQFGSLIKGCILFGNYMAGARWIFSSYVTVEDNLIFGNGLKAPKKADGSYDSSSWAARDIQSQWSHHATVRNNDVRSFAGVKGFGNDGVGAKSTGKKDGVVQWIKVPPVDVNTVEGNTFTTITQAQYQALRAQQINAWRAARDAARDGTVVVTPVTKVTDPKIAGSGEEGGAITYTPGTYAGDVASVDVKAMLLDDGNIWRGIDGSETLNLTVFPAPNPTAPATTRNFSFLETVTDTAGVVTKWRSNVIAVSVESTPVPVTKLTDPAISGSGVPGSPLGYVSGTYDGDVSSFANKVMYLDSGNVWRGIPDEDSENLAVYPNLPVGTKVSVLEIVNGEDGTELKIRSNEVVIAEAPNPCAGVAAERDAAITARDTAIAERDMAITDRDAALSDRDAAASDRDAAQAALVVANDERDQAQADLAALQAARTVYQEAVEGLKAAIDALPTE